MDGSDNLPVIAPVQLRATMINDLFADGHDPSRIMQYDLLPFGTYPLSADPCVTTALRTRVPSPHAHVLSDPRCFIGQSYAQVPLIVDSGASVCVSPRREDFMSYRPSKMHIKDLSSSNKVQGEGMIRWSVLDINGKTVHLDLPGYHIPNAEVRLLSPQVMLPIMDGQASISSTSIDLRLKDGVKLVAPFCPRSRLPMLQLAPANDVRRNLWATTFSYPATVANTYNTVLDDENMNLSNSQKETLLWHQRLSHASISWLQLLMRDRKWLRNQTSEQALHQGPFIPCSTSRSRDCTTSCLKCPSCLTAKATIRTPTCRPIGSGRPSRDDARDLAAKLEGR